MEAAPWFEGFRIRGPVAREFVTVCDMKAIDANFNTSRWSPEIEVGKGRRAAHGIAAQASRGRGRKARVIAAAACCSIRRESRLPSLS
jgi:hypothetical protein